MRRKFIVKDAAGNILRRGETTHDGDLQVFAGPDAADGATVEEVSELPAAPESETKQVSREDVNMFARRLLGDTDWYVMRAQDPEGAPVPQAVWVYRAAVREKAGEIGNLSPIPTDYRDAKYWPDQL